MNEATLTAVNRLAKWRTVLTGRVLGTRALNVTGPQGFTSPGVRDGQVEGFRELFELTLILRAEVTALIHIMAKNGHMTEAQFAAQLESEARHLSNVYAERFPGFKAVDLGMDMDVELARKTMEGWPP